ncbi:MAG: LytR C-terminal domain-containing protein [Candidatus Shapirobacteria bacterium]|jgi:hypothetical protein
MMNKIVPLVAKIIGILVFIGSIVGMVYFYNKSKNVEIQNPGEIEEMVKTLSVFMELPDEIPTLATVTDTTKLESETFFKNAQNGDKVLIFPNSTKAILYRPSTKKVIEVSSVMVSGSQPAAPQPTISPTSLTSSSNLTIALYNGTEEAGLAKSLDKDIFSKTQNYKVTIIADAQKNSYEDTLVIDISGKNQEIAQALAQSLSAVLGPLPLGEQKPDTDILIIIGKNHP